MRFYNTATSNAETGFFKLRKNSMTALVGPSDLLKQIGNAAIPAISSQDGWSSVCVDFSKSESDQYWQVKLIDDKAKNLILESQLEKDNFVINRLDIINLWAFNFDVTVKDVRLEKINVEPGIEGSITVSGSTGKELEAYNKEAVTAQIKLVNENYTSANTADVYAVRYNGNKLVDIMHEEIELAAGESKSHSFDLSEWTMGDQINDPEAEAATGLTAAKLVEGDKIRVFAWYSDNTLTPICRAKEIVYDPERVPADDEEEVVSDAVSVVAAFRNASDDEINAMKDENGIKAVVDLSCDVQREDVTVDLRLVRNNEDVFEESVDIVFEEGSATATIPLTETAQQGDLLKLKVFAGSEIIETKMIGYDNLADTVDVLLVAGQSNALGQGGNAEESLRPELNTVYYNTMGDTTLTTSGNRGWDSALGKTWHELTGHTVLIVKATWGGTGFPTKPNMDTGAIDEYGSDSFGYWNPTDNEGTTTTTTKPYNCYERAKNLYSSAIASIDTGKYTIGDCVYFWNQGENENKSYTASEYEEAFMELHDKFTTEFGTAETRLQYGGILPVRSPYASGTPNLKLTGPRIAQYKMAQENDDIIIAMNATEHWSNATSITDWFNDGTAKTWSYVMNSDNVHYTQKAMNEFGVQAAEAMHAYLYGKKQADGIDLITPTGIKHYKNGDDIVLEKITADTYSHTTEGVIPVVPAMSGAKASFILTGNAAEIDENGVMTAKTALQNDHSTLTVKIDGQADMTFKVYSPLVDETISIASVPDNMPAVYTMTTDDGYKASTALVDGMLKEYGLVATMGLIPNNMKGTKDDILTFDEAKVYVDNGRWSVANHTMTHNQGGFDSLTAEQLEVEIDGGREKLLEEFPGQKVLGIYTPGGKTSNLIVEKARENHYGLRRASGGNNNLPMTEDSIFAINARSIGNFSGATSVATTMNGWIDTAITNNQWVCEMWHGVAVPDENGDLPADADWGAVSSVEADKHLEYVAQKKNEGKLWVATLDDMLAYTTQKLRTKISLVSKDEESLKFSLTDELDDSLFDKKLTVNVKMPDGATGASVSQNGGTIVSTVNDGVLTFSAAPSVNAIEIIWSFNS